jgi:hypothetical protein
MNKPPADMVALANNAQKILEEAGLRCKSGRPRNETGFYVEICPSWVELNFNTGDFFEPSYYAEAEDDTRHRDHPLFLFRRSVTGTMLTTYAAVLYAAGFTVAMHPENENEGAHLVVSGGPRNGIAPGPDFEGPRGG